MQFAYNSENITKQLKTLPKLWVSSTVVLINACSVCTRTSYWRFSYVSYIGKSERISARYIIIFFIILLYLYKLIS